MAALDAQAVESVPGEHVDRIAGVDDVFHRITLVAQQLDEVQRDVGGGMVTMPRTLGFQHQVVGDPVHQQREASDAGRIAVDVHAQQQFPGEFGSVPRKLTWNHYLHDLHGVSRWIVEYQ